MELQGPTLLPLVFPMGFFVLPLLPNYDPANTSQLGPQGEIGLGSPSKR